MDYALIRPVSDGFLDALSAVPPDAPIDVARARHEHAAYRQALASFLGLEVVEAPHDARYPDACFVEDTAVVVGGLAVITRPGAPSRRGEVEATREALAPHLRVHELEEGTLDGGDYLLLGRRLFVGRTARTNEAGIAALARAISPLGVNVVALDPPPDVLHLKCVVSKLADDSVLLAEGTLDPALFAPARVVMAPAHEAYAANAVAHAGRVLMAEGHPVTRERVERAGYVTHAVDNRELRKADSALTCLSVLFSSQP